MDRHYEDKTERPDADRSVRVRFVRREQIDAEKIAEVIIRQTLRAAGDGTDTGRAGTYLQRLLDQGR